MMHVYYIIKPMELIFLEEVDSTNKYAKEHIKDYSDMTLIYTDNQTENGLMPAKITFMLA